MMRCPKCNSQKIKQETYLDIQIIICETCGYDQRDEYDVTDIKQKKGYKSYKTGGSKRSHNI